MAASRGVNNDGIAGNGVATCTVAISPSGANTLIVVAVLEASNSTSGVTYDGNAMTQILSSVGGASGYGETLWYYLAGTTSGSSKNIIASRSSTSNYMEVVVASYYGVAQSNAIDVATSVSNDYSSPVDTSFTVSAGGRVVINALSTYGTSCSNMSEWSAPNGFPMEIWDTTAYGSIGSGTFTASIVVSSVPAGAIMVAFKEAPAPTLNSGFFALM